ncbi:pheST operon leader peptide PheM [Erwinia sp. P7711]|uniref:pheST attenuator peptide n=1 Tax=Erwinia pyri TaxID=3062598 RepID=A0AA50DRN8_9GAMM|nr:MULTISPECIES: pheST operon leader peptide PheM [unclassified Erwinia]MDW8848132.1 pheST operon leader peptide PheM [Erwinia sp. MMLR14_017]WLS80926.1 pheST operon leader peptide PheM [Erwinia sp. DE2]
MSSAIFRFFFYFST